MLNFLIKVAIVGLSKACCVVEELGEKGLIEIAKNQFGEKALKADFEAEEAVIKELEKENIPIRIISEEHGIINITKKPFYLGVFDGLDGSAMYKKQPRGGRYGTMFGIFSGLDPKYEDYLFSGVMEHSTKKLFYTYKKSGAFVMQNKKTKRIFTSNNIQIDKQNKIYIDENFDINRRIFSSKLKGFQTKFLGSSAIYYVDLASGKADLVLECTRKRNLEIAVAYGLIKEAGGVMVSLDGKDLSQRKYLEFGQDKNIPIIAAATKELADELIKLISS